MVNHCDISDADYDVPPRPPRRRARGLPNSSGAYPSVSPIGFQGLGIHQWTSKQLQASMAMQVKHGQKSQMATTPQSSALLSSQLIASANPFPSPQRFQLFGTLVQVSPLLLIAKTLLDPSK